ncbi:hypothetical protein N8599_01050, partial [Verrucomicrobiales bacterium]|nr:hypothetical protein [Verrucomicrobiales bacterium]
LMRTWDAWTDRQDAEELDLEDYRAIGGMSQALSIHADEIFDTFDDKSTRETATRMFRVITEKGDDNRGIRRPLRLQQLADITNHSIEEVKTVVDPYRKQGVTFLMPPSDRELEADTVIDISHESLMRVWQRLRNWVEEEAQSARIYRRLVDTSSLWKKEEAGLYHDPDLQIAQSWRDKYQPNEAWADLYGGGFGVATEFLEASEKEGRKAEREKELARQRELEQAQELAEARERSAKNMKRFAAIVGVVAIIALGAMIFAVKAQKKAVVAQSDAIKAKETLRQEFIRSDINLGLSFSNQGEPRRGIAHFARALERDPHNPSLIDRSFNLLAYKSPPGYISPNLNFGATEIETSTGSKDGSVVITGIHHADIEATKTPNLMVWHPYLKEPIHAIHVTPGRFRNGNDIAISPDGKTAALAVDGLFTVNLENGSTQKIADAITLQAISYSADGSKLLTGTGQNQGNVAQIWDAKTGALIKSYETKAWFPRWSPDETKILFPAHRRGKSAIIDLKTDKLSVFSHEDNPGMSMYGTFDRTGERFLSITWDRKFNVWDIASGELEYSLQHGSGKGGDFDGSVGIFTPDNQKIVTISHDLAIKLWTAEEGIRLDSVNIPQRNAKFQAPLFSDDGFRFMIPLQGGTAYTGTFNNDYSEIPELSDPVPITEAHAFLANNGIIRPLILPSSEIISSTPIGTEGLVAVGQANGIAAIYNLHTGERVSKKLRHSGFINAVAASPDGTKIATASHWGSIKIWDLSDLKSPVQTIGKDDESKIIQQRKIEFSADGDSLWASDNSSMKKWSLDDGKLIQDTKIKPTKSIFISSKDKALTAITKQNFIKIFNNDNNSYKPPISIKCDSIIDAVVFTTDNTSIITGTNTGKVRFWSTENGEKQEAQFDLKYGNTPENIQAMDISVNSDLLAIASKSGNIYIFDLNKEPNNSEPITTIKGDSPSSSVSFSDTGTRLASVFTDGESSYTEAWEARNGFPLTGKINTHKGTSKVQFMNNDTHLFTWPEHLNWVAPDDLEYGGVASLWCISVTEENSSPTDLPSILKGFGKKELNEKSEAVSTASIENKLSKTKNLNPKSNLGKLFNWLKKFPSSRGDSPFRSNPSEKYITLLASETNYSLLNEAIRLRPNDSGLIAKRAASRLSLSDYPSEADKSLSVIDVTKSLLSSPENAGTRIYAGMVHESLGNIDKANDLYKSINKIAELSLDDLLNIISLGEKLNASEEILRNTLDTAILISSKENPDLVKELIVKRFTISAEGGNYEGAKVDWETIKEWKNFPLLGLSNDETDANFLSNLFYSLTEKEADRLVTNNQYEDAINLLQPIAISSLTSSEINLPSSVSKIIEWINRETPSKVIVEAKSKWSYLDDGSDPGQEWYEPWFTTEGWPEGAAKLGYGGDGEDTTIKFGGNLLEKYPTYYFRQKFNVTKESKKKFLYANVIRDDGIIVYINGKEVFRDYMPQGGVDYLTYSSNTAGPGSRGELTPIRFAIDESVLEIGTNIIAAEVHQCNGPSSDVGFQLELLGSDQDASTYIQELLSGENREDILNSAINVIPTPYREDAKAGLLMVFGKLSEKEITQNSLNQIDTGIHISQKLKKNKILLTLIDHQVNLLQSENSTESMVQRVEALGLKKQILIQSGATKETIDELDKRIVSIPRNPNLSEKLIDLSDHYTASMFHFSGWWGGHEGDDLRTLPEQYDQDENIPFDLRGIIQLNSAENDEGKTINEFGWITRHGKVYPEAVRGINIDNKANKIHFLAGLLFGNNVEKGKTAAKIIIHYEDDSQESFSLIAKVDVFDYWIHTRERREPIESLDPDKIGWIGKCARGDDRALTKYSWENPHPDKEISHIDFEGGLSDTAPFIVAITAE